MSEKIDEIDKRILNVVQVDASASVDEISEIVSLSRNACWRRIKALETSGVIKQRVALVDPAKAGVPLTAFVMVKTSSHDEKWISEFQTVLKTMPEVVGAHRMSGDLDYVLRVRLADVPAYDDFYKRLTSRISVSDMSASFVMEDIKETTAVPL
jgi:Lrp/AsnC family transcriptional regulator